MQTLCNQHCYFNYSVAFKWCYCRNFTHNEDNSDINIAYIHMSRKYLWDWMFYYFLRHLTPSYRNHLWVIIALAYFCLNELS